MKILISEIEKNIPYKIKRNFKSIGFDTAQVSGIVILTTDNDYLMIEHLVLSFKTKNPKEIYSTMVRTFERLINIQDLIVVEDIFVGLNPKGALELAKYGAFVIAECIRKNIDYESISAKSARAKFKIDTQICGKGNSKKAISLWLKERLGIDFTDHNLSDAMILGLCSICKDLDFRSQKEIKKYRKKK